MLNNLIYYSITSLWSSAPTPTRAMPMTPHASISMPRATHVEIIGSIRFPTVLFFIFQKPSECIIHRIIKVFYSSTAFEEISPLVDPLS